MTAWSVSVYPCNRSTYGSAASNHATMQNVAFTRWDPLRDLLALHEQLGHLVGTDAPGWTPPVDLYETANEFVLTAELPGLSRDQIEIHVEDSRIASRGADARLLHRWPRLHADREPGGKRRREHLVSAGRPHPQLAVLERPVLPLLLRRRRDVRLARPSLAEPRVGGHHFVRRLRRHQQPRRRRQRA